MAALIWTGTSEAHVMTSAGMFDDLDYTEADESILLASALGIFTLPDGSSSFRPRDPLTRKELAGFAAGYFGKPAVAEEGNAVYADVSKIFFNNQIRLKSEGKELTREEFAVFIAQHLEVDIGGTTLAEQSGFRNGPSGLIEKVEKKEIEPEGRSVYILHIGGEEAELGAHPRVHADSADPHVWEGMYASSVWLGREHGSDEAGGGGSHSDANKEPEAIQFLSVSTEKPAAEKTVKESVPAEQPAKAEKSDSAESRSSAAAWMAASAALIIIMTVILRCRKRK